MASNSKRLQTLSEAVRSLTVRVTGTTGTDKFLKSAWHDLRDDFSAGRIFDFGVVPDAILERYATAATDRALPEMQPPFQDWRFSFCHARAERADGSDAANWPLQITTVHGFSNADVHFSTFLLLSDTIPLELRYIAGVYLFWPAEALPKYMVYTSNKLPSGDFCSALGDPLIAGMLMLNTRNLEVAEILPPRAERRRLARKGETPWSIWSVSTASYYTALVNAGSMQRKTGDAKASSRASPIPHLRRGHWRQVDDGQVWVRDSIINALSPDCPAFVERMRHRIAYRG